MATKKKKAAKKAAPKKKAVKRKTAIKKEVAKKNTARNKVKFVLLPGGLRLAPTVRKKKTLATLNTGISRAVLLEDPATFIHSLLPPFMDVVNPNWEAYAGWNNTTGTPIGSFVAKMTVPKDPKAKNGQTVYLFPGLCSEHLLLQPILQWGLSSMGGDSNWSAGACLVGPTPKKSELFTVANDTQLTARITLQRASGGRFRYTCGFDEVGEANIDGFITEELKYCYVTLEANGIFIRTEYPDALMATIDGIAMTDINNQKLNPTWQVRPHPGQHGEFAKISATPGTIELHYS